MWAQVPTTGILGLQAQDAAPWQSNSAITNLPQIDLGTWNEITNDGSRGDAHPFPLCYELQYSENDVKEDEGFIVKDFGPMFGENGLLAGEADNLDKVMSSPLMTGTRLVYEATGGPIDVDYLFGAGAFPKRLCYFYLPADYSENSDEFFNTEAIAELLKTNRIPLFSLDSDLSTSRHMAHYSKNGTSWDKSDIPVGNTLLGTIMNSPNYNYNNTETGENYTGDDKLTGKIFRLKYFGDDYTTPASDDFPKGTRIYFLLATYYDQITPFSIKFAFRALNKEFGDQGRWQPDSSKENPNPDNENDTMYLNWQRYNAAAEKYAGNGMFAAVGVNFTYTDSEKGTLKNINFMTWEDWTQPLGGSVGDLDMNDLGFGLIGVTNPILDAISNTEIELKVNQKVDDFANGGLINHYIYKFDLKTPDEDPGFKKRVYSRALQPVTFDTEKKEFVPSYTWATIRQFTADNKEGEDIKYLVFRKSAHLPESSDHTPAVEDLNNPELIYRIEYGLTDDKDKLPEQFNGNWRIAGENNTSTDQPYFEHTRGTDNDWNVILLRQMTDIQFEVDEQINPENKYTDKRTFMMTFDFREGYETITNRDWVASPRGTIVVEPRGMLDKVDLADDEVKHLASTEDLAPIDNRTYFTLSYNPEVDLNQKEQLRALFIVDQTGRRFGKILKSNAGDWITQAETDESQTYEIIQVIEPSETDNLRHFLIASTLKPTDDNGMPIKYGMMIETFRATNDGWNNFGIYPQACTMPELIFKEVTLSRNAENPKVLHASTAWQLLHCEHAGDAIFSQWRKYDDPEFVWEGHEGTATYNNILFNNEVATGTMPVNEYNDWYQKAFSEENSLQYFQDSESWTNKDILKVHPDRSHPKVTAEYVLRAYCPATPAILRDKELAPSIRADGSAANYLVLEATKEATQQIVSGIEDVDSEVFSEAPTYFNLQGQKVENPEVGNLYIVVKGDQATKQIFR